MLRDHFRSDDLVCRLGGDEFLVICPETNTAGGVYIAEQVCRAIQQQVISLETIFVGKAVSVWGCRVCLKHERSP